MEWLLLSILVIGLALVPLGSLAVPPVFQIRPMLKTMERGRRDRLREDRAREQALAKALERI